MSTYTLFIPGDSTPIVVEAESLDEATEKAAVLSGQSHFEGDSEPT